MCSAPVEPGGAIALRAPAKINLYLRILAKREDGYHQLDSLMLKLALADRLVLTRRRQPGLTLRCPGSDLPENEDNLVVRAARLFYRHIDQTPALEMVLEKHIPVAAGLGGGSSDAAAVLLGLDRLHGTAMGEGVLSELARPLGADVPFFVQSSPAARAGGIGEILTPAATPPGIGGIVLVNPGFAVSTAWVYRNFRLTKQNDPYTLTGSFADGPLECRNDLEAVTMERYPELKEIRDQLLALGAATALMSGSGPTMFGLFAQTSEAQRCAARMRKKYEKVFLTCPETLRRS